MRFRIWSYKENAFVDNATQYEGLAISTSGEVYSGKYDCVVDGYKAQQSTGKKDLIGVEVYEGDIIKFNFLKPFEISNFIIGVIIGEVRYVERTCSFSCLHEGGVIFLDDIEMEVVGNIFQNKDLLCKR